MGICGDSEYLQWEADAGLFLVPHNTCKPRSDGRHSIMGRAMGKKVKESNLKEEKRVTV